MPRWLTFERPASKEPDYETANSRRVKQIFISCQKGKKKGRFNLIKSTFFFALLGIIDNWKLWLLYRIFNI